MPKRIVDGDAIWTSSRIREVNPPKFRAEYANLIPLALANGSFECDPVLVWTRVYAFNRPDVTFEDAKAILDEFERVGLLFRWANENRKEWGFWVGIDKPGRLPSESQRDRMSRGDDPPIKALREFIKLKENPRTILGQSSLGLGVGVGLGLGKEGVGVGVGVGVGDRNGNPAKTHETRKPKSNPPTSDGRPMKCDQYGTPLAKQDWD